MKRLAIRLAAIAVICLASSAMARQPQFESLAGQYERGGLTAQQLIQLLDLHGQLGATQANKAFEDQLIWQWAADNQLDADAAAEQLSAAYRHVHSAASAAFRNRLNEALAGLPVPGVGDFVPPTYTVDAPLTPLPLPFVLGRPQLGPNEKSGISQISTGIRRRRMP